MVISIGGDKLTPITGVLGAGSALSGVPDVSLAGHDSKLDTVTELAIACGAGDAGGISIVYRAQIWLPSFVGISDSLLPRAGSFCGWVVDNDLSWFEVEDARQDERFAHNPLVAPNPRYIHYAAVALGGQDSSLRGTLWIMSRDPRRLSQEQQAKLRQLGDLAVDVLKLKYCNPVTGMFNCNAFLHYLSVLITQNATSQVVVGCVSLADFRVVVDRFGSESAERILLAVAAALEEWAEGEVIAGHTEGDFFCFAYVDLPAGRTRVVAKLRERIEHAVSNAIGSDLVRVNIGVWRDEASVVADPRQLLDAAVLASMLAKPGQRGFVLEFDQKQLIRMRLHYQLQDAIRALPSAGHILVHYQPQIDISSGQIIGLEALARWAHPSFGMVGPDSFVPHAEARGEIFDLDMRVLELVCADLTEWARMGLCAVPVALNFSRLSLLHPDIIGRVSEVLSRTQVSANLLEFEVTESALIEPSHPLHEPVLALRGRGARVAVDDFGTGYSNLGALNSFPFDRLKVDRQFVHGVGTNPKLAGLFELIHGIAELFEAEVLCEGLEHQSDLEWLQKRGITLVQGWYFSKARNVRDMTNILTTLAQRDAHGVATNLEHLREILDAQCAN